MSLLGTAAFTPIGRAVEVAARKGPVDAGSVSNYQEEAIYPEFAAQGFFIIRGGRRIVAQSAICTHKGCKLTAADDGFKCKCHGSAFAIDGKVTKSPAKRDLPRFAVSVNEEKHLIVDVSRLIGPDGFDTRGAYVEIAPAA